MKSHKTRIPLWQSNRRMQMAPRGPVVDSRHTLDTPTLSQRTDTLAADLQQLKAELSELKTLSARLAQENAHLHKQLALLSNAHLADAASLPPITHLEPSPTIPSSTRPLSRRTLFTGAGTIATGTIAAYAGLKLARPAPVLAAVAMSKGGKPLYQIMDFSPPGSHVSFPPLDTDIAWARQDPVGVGQGHTNEVLSLISDNSQLNSYAWPLYIELRATNNSGATQASSQSVGSTVRFFNRSTGSPWVVGFHSEIHHGQDWNSNNPIPAQGASIGYNCELTSLSSEGETIGLNIQNTSGSNVFGTNAIQIQSATQATGWYNGINFQGGQYIAGNIGINMSTASYNMGIDLGPNSLRMNANQSLVLEHYGSVYIKYNPGTGNIEFYKNNQLVYSI